MVLWVLLLFLFDLLMLHFFRLQLLLSVCHFPRVLLLGKKMGLPELVFTRYSYDSVPYEVGGYNSWLSHQYVTHKWLTIGSTVVCQYCIPRLTVQLNKSWGPHSRNRRQWASTSLPSKSSSDLPLSRTTVTGTSQLSHIGLLSLEFRRLVPSLVTSRRCY